MAVPQVAARQTLRMMLNLSRQHGTVRRPPAGQLYAVRIRKW